MKNTKKLIAAFLCVALILCIAPTNVMAATNPTSLNGFGEAVQSITISGASVESFTKTVTSATVGSYTNYTYTYNIVLTSDASSNSVTATFALKSDYTNGVVSHVPHNAGQSLVHMQSGLNHSTTLSNGTGTITCFVHPNTSTQFGRSDAYVFNFSKGSSSAPAGQYNGFDIQFGDPDYSPTWPESYMTLQSNGTDAWKAIYGPSASSSYYPSVLSLYVKYGTQAVTLSTTDADIKFVTYDASGNEQIDADNTITSTANGSNLFTIKLSGNGGDIKLAAGGKEVTLTFLTPQNTSASGGAHASTINGYLPIGQYATGSGWGSVSGKLTGGVETTGVSLGMLGGYVQFDMGQGNVIANDPTNPYGIDFIIYGNAFVGNPEAGSVMVSEDGKVWYNLAGSRHYMSDTQWDLDVSYLKIDTATTIGSHEFSVGMYYSTDFDPTASDVRTAIANATWTNEFGFGATAWWPDEAAYASGWNDGKVDSSVAGATGDVFWHQLDSGVIEVITYCGVTRVRDDFQITGKTDNSNQTELTNCYQWGYADVRENGSANGTAINPYASNAADVAGGDGFDLSWAVDPQGIPVKLDGVRYVRVYSSVYYYAGMFGETSTEVCGLYVANGNSGSAATTDLTIKKGLQTVSVSNMGSKEIAAGTYSVKSSEANVYINGVKVNASSGYNLSVVAGQKYQIITQNGNEEPFITVLIGK